MTIPKNESRVLILTIGTGDRELLERSLFVPLLKSIKDGDWDRIVLLPSQDTKEKAQELQTRVHDAQIEIEALREIGQENNADACFGHFDAVLSQILAHGVAPDNISLDFTRGTKAMSAALVLAGATHGIPKMRYVHSERRDKRGQVIPGTETVGEVRSDIVMARQRLSLAERLMERGYFEAVVTLFQDNVDTSRITRPKSLGERADSLRTVAEIYGAWDRFEYTKAHELLQRSQGITAPAGMFAQTPVMESWLQTLSAEFDRSDPCKSANYLRHLACDLLANADRRIRDGQFEDALVRCYRVLELIGQIRLFVRGHDSAALDPECPEIKAFAAHLEKSGSHGLSENKSGTERITLSAGREQVARLLKWLEDPFGKQLLTFDRNRKTFKASSRNHSILIHGFKAVTLESEDLLREDLGALEELLIRDEPEARHRLAVARSLSFSDP